MIVCMTFVKLFQLLTRKILNVLVISKHNYDITKGRSTIIIIFTYDNSFHNFLNPYPSPYDFYRMAQGLYMFISWATLIFLNDPLDFQYCKPRGGLCVWKIRNFDLVSHSFSDGSKCRTLHTTCR